MFAKVNYRRTVAVLMALTLVASVLVAAPAAAADDPAPDYTATFDACGGVPGSGFEDVPEGHANAGDIDCIAYYGITKGTSATTYSPLMGVSREHMALFLTRLAGLVGIEVVADPGNTGFTDIGDLSAESQTAIGQLADLGITKGTSATTYSPASNVTRGQMALFISRLMDQMDPMADGDLDYGHTPSDVEDTPDTPVGSPFTDLGSATKSAYDAITDLYELGVASGISDTAYNPSARITRAAMAGFMAAVLDHSNARPAGVTIQASQTSGFGEISDAVIAVSYRDDSFMPMEDVSITIFDSEAVGEFTEDGTCATATDCDWSENESTTDESGNNFDTTGVAEEGKTNTYYAWMGDDDTTEFDADDVDYASVTLSSTTDATAIKVTTDINENADENTVNLDSDSSVTLTVQLVDDDEADVAKSGVTISVGLEQATHEVYPGPDALTTDDNGQATFTITGPESTDEDDLDREDTVTFTPDLDGDAATANAGDAETLTIQWSDEAAALVSSKASAPGYAIVDDDNKVTIKASVTYYDQYGNPAGKGETVTITINSTNTATKRVNSRGTASYSATVDDGTKGTISVTFSEVSGETATANDVYVVNHAPDDSSVSAKIDDVYEDDNRFRIGSDLYSYDSDDTFVQDGDLISLDEFEDAITGDPPAISSVDIVSYDDDGSSIFSIGP